MAERKKPKPLFGFSSASNLGEFWLSHEKLWRFHPDLYPKRERPQKDGEYRVASFEQHLYYGDTRAAVVISTDPLLVAAYSDDLDCVVVLKFPAEFVDEYQLHVGSRLLTVNLYTRGRWRPDIKRGQYAA